MTPLIHYRVAENIFCRSFQADNLSRSDTAFDANYKSIGVGLKTFVCNKNRSNEKIAEFNSLSSKLANFKDERLALELAKYRNERINLAQNLYGIEQSLYHIVARREKELILFESDYKAIDINSIKNVRSTSASLRFNDDYHSYSYNHSKSTLFREFIIPNNAFKMPVDIIDDPYKVILDIFNQPKLPQKTQLVKGVDFVILPLYGRGKEVFPKSGLNQWNARGRERNFGEMYIPVPSNIRKNFGNFFPDKGVSFDLQVPTGEVFSASLCQDGGKALMTNPNKELADWLLRRLLKLEEGELATTEKLDDLHINSVIITKKEDGKFLIDKAKFDSYESFFDEDEAEEF